jgi:hypothetical protein
MPLVTEVHLDAVLTEFSVAFKNSSLVADQIWPIVKVAKDSDVYYEYDKSNLRPDETKWAPKTNAKEVNWSASRTSYVTERHGLAELIEDDEVQNADSPISVMADSTEIMTEKMLIRREKRLATILTTSGNFDADARPTLGAADQWSNYGSTDSDPNEDIATARKVVYKKTFMRPNIVVLPYEVYETVREHPRVIDRVKYVDRAIITAEILASLWDVEQVIIAGAGENTAVEGAADSLSYVWGKNAWVGFRAPSPKLKMPSWGYHICSQNLQVDRWRDDPRKGEMVRVSFKEVPKKVAQGAGYWIQAAIA